MINTYLVQRAKFADNPEKKGIDKILNFDYMGSSEFEWGALPKALKSLRAAKKNFVYGDHEVNGFTFTVFGTKEVQKEFNTWLQKVINRKIRLKETSRIEWLHEKDDYHSPTFWWSLCDDFMFWLKDDDFKTKFETHI